MEKIFFAFLLLFSLTQVEAQQGKERIEAFKAAFFTEQLELSSQEARDFWPVYDEYEAEKEALKSQYKRNRKIELLSDAEVENYLIQQFEFEEKQLAVKRKYFERFKEILPIRKVARLNKTERAFKQKLLQLMKERRQQRKRNN